MSIPDATSSERVSVPRILADLLLLLDKHKLPSPHHMGATDANGIASIDVRSRAAFDAWMEALGCSSDGYVSDQPFEGGRITSAPSVERLGWSVSLVARYAEADTQLPAETLTALDHIANPPAELPRHRLVTAMGGDGIMGSVCACGTAFDGFENSALLDRLFDDHCARGNALPVVTDERVEEILTHLNSFVDHEYEGGTELRNGIAVRVKTVVGTDFNLEQAITWAREQPELKKFTEPAFPANLYITLIDDTVLFWDTEASAWTVEAKS